MEVGDVTASAVGDRDDAGASGLLRHTRAAASGNNGVSHGDTACGLLI